MLSEKPIAENVKDAEELVAWYRANVDASKVTWGVAENFRFLNSFRRAGEIAARLGRVLSFRMRMGALVKGGKYYGAFALACPTLPLTFPCHFVSIDVFAPLLGLALHVGTSCLYSRAPAYLETEWRKTPTHQGGFVLDAGVHFLAGLRCLLGRDPANRITHLSAFSTQNQPHLPPLDTVDACLRTKGGGTGVVSVSFGTTLGGSEYAAGFERGSVSVVPGMASKMVHGKAVERNVGVVSWREVGQGEGKEGTEEKEEVEDEGTGVMPEVRAWGEGLAKGQLDERQGVEEALADLEIVSLLLLCFAFLSFPVLFPVSHLRQTTAAAADVVVVAVVCVLRMFSLANWMAIARMYLQERRGGREAGGVPTAGVDWGKNRDIEKTVPSRASARSEGLVNHSMPLCR